MITGCSTGIGRALAEAFLEAGHRVVATARRPESITDLEGERGLTLPLNVTDGESIETATAEALRWAGRVDILVNNAGYALVGPVSELDLDVRIVEIGDAVRL